MIDQKQIDKILNRSSVYKFTSIDKHIAFVLGNNVERCKAALYKTTALKVTLIDERSAIRLKNYVQKRCKDTEILLSEYHPVILHNEILPF